MVVPVQLLDSSIKRILMSIWFLCILWSKTFFFVGQNVHKSLAMYQLNFLQVYTQYTVSVYCVCVSYTAFEVSLDSGKALCKEDTFCCCFAKFPTMFRI